MASTLHDTCEPRQPSSADAGIIFSSLDGYVWVSWRGSDAAVKLGRHDIVAEVMLDFLMQDALARKLMAGPRKGQDLTMSNARLEALA